jgi:hypothetical protein
MQKNYDKSKVQDIVKEFLQIMVARGVTIQEAQAIGTIMRHETCLPVMPTIAFQPRQLKEGESYG